MVAQQGKGNVFPLAAIKYLTEQVVGAQMQTFKIRLAQGDIFFGTNGLIDRKKLGIAVFGHTDTPNRLHKLNTITHKYVLERTFATAGTMLQNGAVAVLIDAPQLFEAHLERDCELVIGVLAELPIRLSRILARDGITEEAAMKRIAAQKSDDFFRENCHMILENNGDLTALEAQIPTFLKNQGMLSPTEEHK